MQVLSGKQQHHYIYGMLYKRAHRSLRGDDRLDGHRVEDAQKEDGHVQRPQHICHVL